MNLRRSIGESVLAHWVDDAFVLLAGLDQRVHERLLVLRVYVVIVGAENNEQLAMQLSGTIHQRSSFVKLGMVLWQLDHRFRPL